jgi:hypothetical protein
MTTLLGNHPDIVNSIDAKGTGGGNLVNILCVDQIAGLTAGSDGAVDDVREGLIDLSGFGKTSISRPASSQGSSWPAPIC